MYDLICIGASWGGLHAVGRVLNDIPKAVDPPIVVAQHNLVSDRSFNEFNVILCRNVMIYFDRALQDRVHRLFYDSLSHLGVLALGHKESIHFSPFEDRYEELDPHEKLYRKVT